MKLLLILYLLSFLIYMIFGTFVLYLYFLNNKKNLLYIILFLICLLLSFASFNYAFLVSSKSKIECWFWFKMTIPTITLLPAIFLNLFYFITKYYNKKFIILIYINYFIGFIFLIKGIVGNFTISDFILKTYGWEGVHLIGHFWYNAYTVYYIFNIILGIILVLNWYFKTKINREKIQAKIILITSIITSLINFVIQTVLPFMKIYSIPKAPFFVILIWIIGVLYAMIKYRFIIPDFNISSDEIISSIDEIVIIVDQEFRIIQANKKFLDLVGLKAVDIKNKIIFDFISFDYNIKDYFKLLIDRIKEKLYCRINYYKNNNKKDLIITDSYISVIKDRFSDITGILIISKEKKEIKQFLKIYKITKRELEIIELTLSGLSNSEISNKLNISRRTVETHLTNIYNKIGINNKIELFDIANNFNIVKKNCI